MNVITVEGLSKFFGEKQILKDITFTVCSGQRVGLVGRNGAGKTTLFRILTGELPYEQGTVAIHPSVKAGILDQIPVYPEGTTVLRVLRSAFAGAAEIKTEMEKAERELTENPGDALLIRHYGELMTAYEAAGGYEADYEIEKAANGLSIGGETLARPFTLLSGGEQTRVNLARMILMKTDFLLLDEPTNHLDMKAIEWLEEFLTGFDGTAVIISHDRYFLDRVTTRTIELCDMEADVYEGNYSYYAQEKQAYLEQQKARYEQEQKVISRLEFTAKRMRGWGLGNKKVMRRAFALEKRIERLRRDQAEQVREKKELRTGFAGGSRSGNEVLHVKELRKTFGERVILDSVTLEMRKDECVALIGENGTGKTTLLKLLLGLSEPDSGLIKWGAGLKMAYLPQIVQFADSGATMLETAVAELEITPAMARNRLASFHFQGDEVFKPISALSGGEKSRLRLCILMYSGINLLILDEPTNHLDIQSREWLEEALEGFEGTMLFVSHDRYFIDRFATNIWELSGGEITVFSGTFEEYAKVRERERQVAELAKKVKREGAPAKEKQAASPASRDKREAARRAASAERELADAERQAAELDRAMEAAATDHEELLCLCKQKEELRERIDELFAHWAELAENAEK